MHVKLIANPCAGRKAGILLPRPSLDDVVALLGRYEIAADLSLTEYRGHATELAAAAAQQGYDAVLVAGGDGTVHEVSQALVRTPVKLGILPLGSVMNLCRALAIPRDLEGAVQVIRMNHVIALDVGQAPGRYFLEIVGAGIDAGIFRHLNEVDEGHWASLGDLVHFLRHYEAVPLEIQVDGRYIHQHALMVLVANSPFYDGIGLRLAPRAKMNDGLLDVVIIDSIGKLKFIWYALRSLLPGQAAMPATRHFRGRTVTIKAPRGLPAHADSFVLESTDLSFSVLPAALQVYAGFPAHRRQSALVEHRKPHISLPFRRAA